MIEDKNKIATEELFLNIKHQNIQVENFSGIGYEFEKRIWVCLLIIPFKELGLELKGVKI